MYLGPAAGAPRLKRSQLRAQGQRLHSSSRALEARQWQPAGDEAAFPTTPPRQRIAASMTRLRNREVSFGQAGDASAPAAHDDGASRWAAFPSEAARGPTHAA
eukprot:365930-Chlamydomonas_euryale.AAC.12